MSPVEPFVTHQCFSVTNFPCLHKRFNIWLFAAQDGALESREMTARAMILLRYSSEAAKKPGNTDAKTLLDLL